MRPSRTLVPRIAALVRPQYSSTIGQMVSASALPQSSTAVPDAGVAGPSRAVARGWWSECSGSGNEAQQVDPPRFTPNRASSSLALSTTPLQFAAPASPAMSDSESLVQSIPHQASTVPFAAYPAVTPATATIAATGAAVVATVPAPTLAWCDFLSMV